jgi:peptidoglycan L-alanyl-D-glutamate endopeptidase CwlK
MTHALGQTSLSRARRVDPVLMSVVALALTRSSVDMGVTEEQSRTRAEQQHKFDTGVSRVRPGPAARHMIQADGYSKAIDVVPWINGAFTWGDGQWRAPGPGGGLIYPFHEFALAMRSAAIETGVPMRWGAIWDRHLSDLPGDVAGLRQAVESYKVRHVGSDLLDGPHYELV